MGMQSTTRRYVSAVSASIDGSDALTFSSGDLGTLLFAETMPALTSVERRLAMFGGATGVGDIEDDTGSWLICREPCKRSTVLLCRMKSLTDTIG